MVELKIKASGGIRLDLNLIYYPLGELWYAVNSNNMKYVVQAIPVMEEQSDKDKQSKKKGKVKYWLLKLNDIESYQLSRQKSLYQPHHHPNRDILFQK